MSCFSIELLVESQCERWKKSLIILIFLLTSILISVFISQVLIHISFKGHLRRSFWRLICLRNLMICLLLILMWVILNQWLNCWASAYEQLQREMRSTLTQENIWTASVHSISKLKWTSFVPPGGQNYIRVFKRCTTEELYWSYIHLPRSLHV